MSIADMVESVRRARAEYAALADAIKEERAKFEERLIIPLQMQAEAKETLDEAERQLRAAAEAHFAATGEKRPHPAVLIQERKTVTKCEYPATEALKYALENGVALQLDEHLFETYMQALPEPSRPAWFRLVTTTPAPRATIAKEIAAPEVKEATNGD